MAGSAPADRFVADPPCRGDILYRFWWRVPIADAIATIMNMAITSHSKNNIAQLTSIVIVPPLSALSKRPRALLWDRYQSRIHLATGLNAMVR